MTHAELIVVGAGPFGLIAAHTWLELNPESEILVIESDTEVGGVWSKNRVYPGMMSQTPVGMFEYSGYPMDQCKDTYYDHFPGPHGFTYLDNFSQVKRFAGKTVKERIKFSTTVTRITKNGDLWTLETETSTQYTCSKLIMAIGVTSTPHIPKFINRDFQPPIIHTKTLASQSSFLSSPSVGSVVLVGGSKSAFDAAQLLVKAGKDVHWVIRRNGQGPALITTPDAPPPLKNSHEVVSLGVISATSPCIFAPMNAWTRFFHQTRLGMALGAMMWRVTNWMWCRAAQYDRNENFKLLKPDRPAYWSSDNVGVGNSPGIWGQLAKTTVYRDEIDYLEGNDVVLVSGKRRNCDALVVCTGWVTSFPMFDTSDALALGLPLPISSTPPEELDQWEKRIAAADKTVVETFPSLANSPKFPERTTTQAPNRLYRYIVPTVAPKFDQDGTIVFLGLIGTTDSPLVGEIQSLWAAAYLMGKLEMPSQEKLQEQVALATAWRRRRYLGDSHTILYEQLQYVAMLLRDLGLNDLRKGGGWRKEMFDPYVPKDYRGVLEEWTSKNI